MAKATPTVEGMPPLNDAKATPPQMGMSVASTDKEYRVPISSPSVTVTSGSAHRIRFTYPGLICVALALKSTKPAVHTALS